MNRMTIAQACDVLRVSRWTLDRLIDAGEITATKEDPKRHNSTVWVSVASIRAYIDRHTVPATNRAGE